VTGKVVSEIELHSRLRGAARLAQRVVWSRQLRDWAGDRRDHVMISRLGLAAFGLDAAADQFGADSPNRRSMIGSTVAVIVWVVSCVTVLLLVDRPTRPPVLVGTMIVTMVCGALAGRVVLFFWDRRICGSVTAEVPPADVDVIIELRQRVQSLSAALEVVDGERPHRGGDGGDRRVTRDERRRRAAGEELDGVRVWLTFAAAAMEATPPAGTDTADPRRTGS
jgi:hypothetical protein